MNAKIKSRLSTAAPSIKFHRRSQEKKKGTSSPPLQTSLLHQETIHRLHRSQGGLL